MGTPFWRLAAACLFALWMCLTPHVAGAGVMDAASMKSAFPLPLIVGEKDKALPVWPIYKQEATETVLVGYAFESIDLAPLPGFSGTPVNLLVLLDARGEFRDVRVLSQHEPVFLDGLGPEPLDKFVAQYKGLNLKQHVKIDSRAKRDGQEGSGTREDEEGRKHRQKMPQPDVQAARHARRRLVARRRAAARGSRPAIPLEPQREMADPLRLLLRCRRVPARVSPRPPAHAIAGRAVAGHGHRLAGVGAGKDFLAPGTGVCRFLRGLRRDGRLEAVTKPMTYSHDPQGELDKPLFPISQERK